MATRFEKLKVPPLFEFDGFDPKVMYQMVPVTEARAMSVVTDTDECAIVVDPPNIARMRNFHFAKGVPDAPTDFLVRLTAQNQVTFEIFGEKTGNTTIKLLDPKGKAVGGLLVSVKSTIAKTASLCRLSDMKRNCPWPSPLPASLFSNVGKVYKQQANIEFTQRSGVFDVTVPADLGNPLIVDQAAARRRTIISATPAAAFGANFVVYLTWDLRSVTGDIVGQNFGQLCFVEFDSNVFEQGVTMAHELGHGLGLSHTGAKTLMNADGISRSSLLQQFEIDTINRTDETP
jgi:hypothetical protein